MSVYCNQMNVQMSEVATLIFNHVIGDKSVTVAQVVIPIGLFETFPKFIQDTLDKHKENQVENKSKLS